MNSVIFYIRSIYSHGNHFVLGLDCRHDVFKPIHMSQTTIRKLRKLKHSNHSQSSDRHFDPQNVADVASKYMISEKEARAIIQVVLLIFRSFFLSFYYYRSTIIQSSRTNANALVFMDIHLVLTCVNAGC